MDNVAWYYLDGRVARLFRPGERIEAGERLGTRGGREVVHRDREGTVVSIQYDVWRDEVIVGVAPASNATVPALGFAGSL